LSAVSDASIDHETWLPDRVWGKDAREAMGICIAYRGKLRGPARVGAFVDDLKAKAGSVGWPCKTMAELVVEGTVRCAGLEGITLYPHRACDPLHFHFDREGTFVNHFYYSLLVDPAEAAMVRQALAESMAFTCKATSPRSAARRSDAAHHENEPQVQLGAPPMPEDAESLFEGGVRYNWTKTQFAGAKVHAAVCAILRYVQQRHAPELVVTDDSDYFVDGDAEKLEAQLAHVDYLVSITSHAVAAAAATEDAMTLDDFVDCINRELAEAKHRLH
jgi:hypothetical protein